jgi:pimeloyl-ACP methyl ester carboxylesterase
MNLTPHFVEHGGKPGAPRTVLVHGLGGSHVNWTSLGPRLAETTRPVALDLAGFGFTPGTARTGTVAANARLLARFVRETVGEPVTLVGNSMGGMVSVMCAVAEPDLVEGVVLLDPVLPKPRGVRRDRQVVAGFAVSVLPGISTRLIARRRAATPARARVEQTLALCCRDVSTVSPEQIAAEVALTEARASDPRAAGDIPAYVAATRSLILHAASPAYRRQLAAIAAPVLLLHGVHDRLVPVAAADATAQALPRWTYHRLEAGHIPHMEAAAESAQLITTWIEGSRRS